MDLIRETAERLSSLATLSQSVQVRRDCPLSEYTRFGIGGPAAILVETPEPDVFIEALRIARASGLPWVVIGGGTNLVVSDQGFAGVVLKLANLQIEANGSEVTADAGAVLQDLVDFTVDRGLAGLQTMTGIPGSVGAAIYGNAGAYGHSSQEIVKWVRFFDGEGIRFFANAECQFHYRESIFKRHKEWIILQVGFVLQPGDPVVLRETADRILGVRNRKYPPTMKCAGSIFKNFLFAELPPAVAAQVPSTAVIEGKVPSAWFLEQVGAKGMRCGGIQVADYHANLIYNEGNGTARELTGIIAELKKRVTDRWGISLEEEVQYVGFDSASANSGN
jgi:UDP-N-acetylmuramate dehydrogenase